MSAIALHAKTNAPANSYNKGKTTDYSNAQNATEYANKVTDIGGLAASVERTTGQNADNQVDRDILLQNHVSPEEKRKYFHDVICKGKCSEVRMIIFNIVDHSYFVNFMYLIIVLNAATMVMASATPSSAQRFSYLCDFFEPIFLAFYIIEAVLKIYARRSHYFQSGWDLFDLLIIVLAMIDIVGQLTAELGIPDLVSTAVGGHGNNNSIYLSHLLKALKITRILKSFRSLKVIRLIKVVDSIFIIFSTILVSMQAVLSIVIMLGLIVLLFSIILYTMYAEVPNQGYFNTYGNTWFTLIQILTLDDWYGIYCDLVYQQKKQYDVTLFMALFIYLIGTYFITLNLFVAVLFNNFQEKKRALRRKAEQDATLAMKEDRALQKAAGDLADVSDVNIRARLQFLDDMNINENEDGNSSDDYESSASEFEEDEIRQECIDKVKKTMCGVEQKIKPSKKELNANYWYYRLLPAIEKQMHIATDRLTTHDRIIGVLMDDPEEMLAL